MLAITNYQVYVERFQDRQRMAIQMHDIRRAEAAANQAAHQPSRLSVWLGRQLVQWGQHLQGQPSTIERYAD